MNVSGPKPCLGAKTIPPQYRLTNAVRTRTRQLIRLDSVYFMSNIIRPKKLKKGDTIGVVSPGRWMTEEDLESGANNLGRQGFSVVIHPQNLQRDHQFAGKTEARRAAVEDMFSDPSIDAIMFAKGGHGTLSILDSFDYRIALDHPKIIVGYSDATALLIALNAKTDLVTFHGPMLYDFRQPVDEYTWEHFEQLVISGKAITETFDRDSGLKVLRPGTSSGRALAGNLTLLVNLIGTGTDFDTNNVILFIEDDDEFLYNIDRMFLHLRRSGRLSRLSGLVIGRVTNLKDNVVPFGYSVDEIAAHHCRDCGFPIISGFPFGHRGSQLSIPLGIPIQLSAEADGRVSFSIEEPAVTS